MKKILLALLSILSINAHAAVAPVVIDNSNNPCGVYVVLCAYDAAYGSFTANQFYIANGTVAAWGSVFDFQNPSCTSCTQAGPDWYSITSGGISTMTTTFQWTNASFQFDCNHGCTDSGGGLTNPYSPLPASCLSATDTWTGSCRSAQWHTSAAPLDGINISFH